VQQFSKSMVNNSFITFITKSTTRSGQQKTVQDNLNGFLFGAGGVT
jgi:hypothetical protein